MKYLYLLPIILLFNSCNLLLPDEWGSNHYQVNCYRIHRIARVQIAYAEGRDSREKVFLYPRFITDTRQSLESYTYYFALDTVLHRSYTTHGAEPPLKWEAFDWRITKMDAITLVDLDESHPAGTSVADLLKVRSCFRGKQSCYKLSDVGYGDIMLQDYYDNLFAAETVQDFLNVYNLSEWQQKYLPYCALHFEPVGVPIIDFHNIEIHIYTAFGDHFIARSETKEQEGNEKDNNNII